MSTNSFPLATKTSGLELTEQDILSRLINTEDSTVERKTASDYRDCLKTAVAFSNSLAVGDPGLIFVGVGNDGTVQDNRNLDSLQKDVSKELNKIYPPIAAQMLIRKDVNGKEFLVVVVRGSPNRPHFAGPSYIRVGSETKEASEQQFQQLIAERNSKVREILKHKGKPVTVRNWEDMASFAGVSLNKGGSFQFTVVDCNQYFVTIAHGERKDSISLPRSEISYDDASQCLRLEVHSL